MTRLATMNDNQGESSNSEDQQQKMALLQSLLKGTEDSASSAYNTSSQHSTMRSMENHSSGHSSNLLNPFHQQNADQILFQQRAIDNMAFGGLVNQEQQLPGIQQQPSDDIMLLSRQLLQQQQQQLQQQHQLLFQAGAGFGGANLAIGANTSNNFGGNGSGTALGGPSLGGMVLGGSSLDATGFGGSSMGAAGLLGQPLGDNGLLAYTQQGSLHHGHMPSADQDIFSSSIVASDQTVQRRSESFPMTLHRLLVDLEVAGGANIATYVAGGDAFLIRNPKGFEERIIPKYFPRMGSFGSFQRQLNLYDFKRVSQGSHRGAYTHPLFRRQFPQMLRQMKRTKIKGLRKNFKKNKEIDETHDPTIAGEGPDGPPSNAL